MKRRIDMKPSFKLTLLAAVLSVAVLATACSSDPTSSGSEPTNGGGDSTSEPSGAQESEPGDGQSTDGNEQSASQGVTVSIDGPGQSETDTEVIITLNDADDDAGAEVPARESTVSGDPLDAGDVTNLLDRLPDLEAEDDDQVEFRRPPQTRPRPRPGATVDQTFPPAGDVDTVEPDSGPLEVLRFQPTGAVDLAPFISVTFNQPMIELSTVSQVEAADVPITITPEIPGRWIWLGTRTARFEYEPGVIDRLPAATNYQVEIAAGVQSATGAELDQGTTFNFSTPTPQVEAANPLSRQEQGQSNQSLSTEQIFFLRFDQRVDPEAVLGTVDLLADGQDVAIRLASAEEINEDTRTANLAENALPERWLALRSVDPLPTNAAIVLRIGPNVPSAEGPETSDEVATFIGRTFGPFAVRESQCGYDDTCEPGQTLQIQMTNPIDTETFTSDMVSIDPLLPGARIGVNYGSITVQGATKGRTEYEITLRADLADEFGQELGEDTPVRFEIDDAKPALFRPGRSLVTLDPFVDTPQLNVTSINNAELEITTYRVDPATDWPTFTENQYDLSRGQFASQWDIISTRTVTTTAGTNEFVETAFDLSSDLGDGSHIVAVVAPTERDENDYRNEPFAVWIQQTAIGLDALADNQDAVAWVTDLRTGAPVENATVTIVGGNSQTTDSEGVARIELPRQSRGMIAQAGDDIALVGDFWAERYDQDNGLAWHVFDDRGLYKPGETANVKGWVRGVNPAVPSDLSLPEEGGTVQWTSFDAFGNEIGAGEAELSALGGFDFTVKLPDDITLGSAGIEFNTTAFAGVNSGGNWHELRVQEFRRPDFEVVAEIADPEPHLAGETFTATVQANFFAGGALGQSDVDWFVIGQPTSYSPPNWADYTFGVWVPWWFSGGFGFEDDFFAGGFGSSLDSEWFSARTNPAGAHGLDVTIETEGTRRPVQVTARATVFDVNRQPVSNSTSTLVHPANLYVGLKGDRTFVQAGERIDLDVIVADIDGTAVAAVPVSVEAVLLEWRFENGEWAEVEVPFETCDVTSDDEAVVCTFRPEDGGRYQITATVIDDAGRSNISQLTRWVAGGDRPTSRRVDLEEVTLVPNAQSFQPGDEAEILVQSPFTDAHGLLVISRGGIDRTQSIEFDDNGAAVVRVPVTEQDIPGIGLQFEVAGSAPRTDGGEGDDAVAPRPAFASAQLQLDVPADERALSIDVAPRLANLEPGSDTQVDVVVTNAEGDPVANAELTVVVVDEAVLSLSNYQLRDPLTAFYQQMGGYIQAFRGRSSLLLGDPDAFGTGDGGGGETAAAADTAFADEEAMDDEESTADSGPAFTGGDDAFAASAIREAAQSASASSVGQDGESAAIELRTNFDALAVFEPEVTTDADGRATIDVPLPDNLTRYRVMVVATAEATNAGTGESNITARLPITVRPTPPRFANFGDTFEFPVVVQNATDEDLDVDVALRSINLSVDGRDGTTVRVPANDRIEVRFEVSAVEAGTARYQIAASAGSFADAADGDFPVYTPATSEAFATYGVIDEGSIAQPFAELEDVWPQFGGLEITTSSTAVSALTDAMIYLGEYRYENSDAFASRILAVVALDDILTAFESPQLPTADELRSIVNNDLDRLAGLQNNDGGFPYWRRGRESVPYNSVQATHALVLAQQADFVVDQQVLNSALAYLGNIESFLPNWYSESTRRSISGYALHVRNLANDADVAKATQLYRDAGADIELDVAAWLWPTLAETELDTEIEQLLNNRVTETPNAATFATDYGEQEWVLLHSDRRTDAIVLDALISQRPGSDLVQKTLNGVLAARDSRGRWTNVQENSFVLLAGAAFFEQFEADNPDFIARAWLGDTYAVEQPYQGRSTDQNVTLIPLAELVDAGDTDIVVQRDGAEGQLYYRLGLRYAPTDFDLEPRDQGFVVQRTYEAVDEDDDVVQNDDGSWTVKAGARVRVQLTMIADSRRTHVALIDPIPAGFEIINPALATSEPIPQADPSESAFRGFWWFQWFDHQNLRDDRAEAFSTWLGAGSYEYSYVARATTPGTFNTPPTRAEQIYEPEVFGRSASTTVTVTDS